MIPKRSPRPFWNLGRQGAEDAGRELNVDINWSVPDSESTVSGQVKLIESAVNQGVDGIVLAPLDGAAVGGAIDKAARAKIPVVLLDSDAATKNKISVVAPDNYQSGRLVALYVGKITRGKGAVLTAPSNATAARVRAQGFEKTLREKFPGLKVIRSATPQSAAAVQDVLAAHPEVTVIFGPDENSTVGALRAMRNRKLSSKVSLIGFGSADILVDALKSGDIKSLAVENPYKMGYEGIKAIVDFKAGRIVQPRIDSGFKLITQTDMDTPENQKLLVK